VRGTGVREVERWADGRLVGMWETSGLDFASACDLADVTEVHPTVLVVDMAGEVVSACYAGA
jgi:hypothetical protein